MRANHPPAAIYFRRTLGNRQTRRIGRQDRIFRRQPLQLGEKRLLQCQILRHGLHHQARLCDRLRQIGRRPNPGQYFIRACHQPIAPQLLQALRDALHTQIQGLVADPIEPHFARPLRQN